MFIAQSGYLQLGLVIELVITCVTPRVLVSLASETTPVYVYGTKMDHVGLKVNSQYYNFLLK